eukprot:CAMPEP_0178909714 /NCGR_PEP_ID=MMETSP0786-20121207/8686_1 /TAXON_ID=186022 /ORGANISM="Thalassionema frauenfeldii, Strain CCMP 1798" /LENGTH=1350 /DNA_ID=CAMNT_0020581867 /DNA_START=22 /DNA_END=4074 /DNA_ORIENTATION=+
MSRKRNSSGEGTEEAIPMNVESPRKKNEDEDEDETMDGVEYSNDEESTEPSFLDTFYGLSSESNDDRSQAAQLMLNHCLLGPSANVKDAAYAFRRLLNGLCSGRAAARQGYASALTSFLKLSHEMGVLHSINTNGNESSTLSFVRDQLVKTTDPKDTDCTKYGKRKGSEERDHHFGRLFGILSVIRSGILLSKKGQTDLHQTKSVSAGFVRDLIGLYNHRKWMREPSAYAMINLIDSFYSLCPQKEASQVVEFLVSDVVTPDLLSSTSLQGYTAEQIAVALNIQAQSKEHDISLPPNLRSEILSSRTVPALAQTLSSTSVVSQPRAHVVWDIIWCPFLTVPSQQSGKSSKKKSNQRKLRKELPECSDTALDVVKVIVNHVIMGSLLGVEQESKMHSGNNATHGRRALALSLVEVLCGCESFSPKAGPFHIQIEGGILENTILTPAIVQKLFLDVISARGGKQGGPLLRPMALKVLQSVVDSCSLFPDDYGKRFSCAKAILSCDPRFDCRTKSAACSSLLFLENDQSGAITTSILELWKQYVSFLIGKVLSSATKSAKGDQSSASYEALGYIDLVYTFTKKMFRLSQSSKLGTIDDIRDEVLSFLFVGSYFDCSELKAGDDEGILQAAMKINTGLVGLPSLLPFAVRVVMSAADFATTLQSARDSSPEDVTKSTKELSLLNLLITFSNGCQKLENHGCKRLVPINDADDETVVTAIVLKQQGAAINLDHASSMCLQRFRVGCAILSSILHVNLLRCGQANELSGSENMDLDEEEEDDSEVKEFISDLASAQHNLMVALGILEKEASEDETTETENALTDFANVCGVILSSNLNEQGQIGGATPKLLREAVKTAWSSALRLCIEHESKTLFDVSLQNALLEFIGVDLQDLQEEDQEDASDLEGEDSDIDEDDNEGNVGIFAKAASSNVDIEDSAEVSSDEDANIDVNMDDDDEDVELDDSQLQTILMEDDDEDEDSYGLEHHAGADAALAKLIKLKQDARKAGQQARERIVLLNQLRCVLLLDITLRQINDQKFAFDFVDNMLLPILQTRRVLEKAVIAGRVGQKPAPNDNEKRDMVEKLTSLIKTKLFKIKKVSEIEEAKFSQLALSIMDEARKDGSEGHSQCCSSALIFLFRTSPSMSSMAALRPKFCKLVSEWATKRRSHVKTSFFENIVEQHLCFAKVVLVNPLCQASKDARSTFLKCECFRLLSSFWSDNEKKKEPDSQEMGAEWLVENCSLFADSMFEAMKDAEMRKTRRVRDLLKTADKFIDYIQNKMVDEPRLINTMTSFISECKTLNETTESSSVKSFCEILRQKIENFISQSQSRLAEAQTISEEPQSSKKKKKKKKKGKKR